MGKKMNWKKRYRELKPGMVCRILPPTKRIYNSYGSDHFVNKLNIITLNKEYYKTSTYESWWTIKESEGEGYRFKICNKDFEVI